MGEMVRCLLFLFLGSLGANGVAEGIADGPGSPVSIAAGGLGTVRVAEMFKPVVVGTLAVMVTLVAAGTVILTGAGLGNNGALTLIVAVGDVSSGVVLGDNSNDSSSPRISCGT